MKFKALGIDEDKIESHPARGAWIEMSVTLPVDDILP